MRKLMLFTAALVCTLCLASPAQAIIVHHCDYAPESLAPGVHNRDESDPNRDCGNMVNAGGMDQTNQTGLPGSCSHENAYYWTELNCGGSPSGFSATACTISGKIDCPGGDRGYFLSCAGNNVQARAGRESAACLSSNDYQECSCESSLSSSCWAN
jgi:hypothetical protein